MRIKYCVKLKCAGQVCRVFKRFFCWRRTKLEGHWQCAFPLLITMEEDWFPLRDPLVANLKSTIRKFTVRYSGGLEGMTAFPGTSDKFFRKQSKKAADREKDICREYTHILDLEMLVK